MTQSIFDRLPIQIIDRTIDYFDQASLLHICLVCKAFRQLAKSRLYLNLYLQDYKRLRYDFSRQHQERWSYLSNDYNILRNSEELFDSSRSEIALRPTVYLHKRSIKFIENLTLILKNISEDSKLQIKKLIIDFTNKDEAHSIAFNLILRIILISENLTHIEFRDTYLHQKFKGYIQELLAKKLLVIDSLLDYPQNLEENRKRKRQNSVNETSTTVKAPQTVDVTKIPNKNIQLILKKKLLMESANHKILKISFRTFLLIFNNVICNFSNNFYLEQNSISFEENNGYFKRFAKETLLNDEYINYLRKNKYLINETDCIDYRFKVKYFDLELNGFSHLVENLQRIHRLATQAGNFEAGHLYNDVEVLNLRTELKASIFTDAVRLPAFQRTLIQNGTYDSSNDNNSDGDDALRQNILYYFINFQKIKKLAVTCMPSNMHTNYFPQLIKVLSANFDDEFANLTELSLESIPMIDSQDRSVFRENLNSIFDFADKCENLKSLQLDFTTEGDKNHWQENVNALVEVFQNHKEKLEKLELFNLNCFSSWLMLELPWSLKTQFCDILDNHQIHYNTPHQHQEQQKRLNCNCKTCNFISSIQRSLSSDDVVVSTLEFLNKLNWPIFWHGDISKYPIPAITLQSWILNKEIFNSRNVLCDGKDFDSCRADLFLGKLARAHAEDLISQYRLVQLTHYELINLIIESHVHLFQGLISLFLEKFPFAKVLVIGNVPISIKPGNYKVLNSSYSKNRRSKSDKYLQYEDLASWPKCITVGRRTYSCTSLIKLSEDYNNDGNKEEYDIPKEREKVENFYKEVLKRYDFF